MAKDLGGGRIQVERGDTLWGIAQQFLGNGSRWRELGFTGDPRKMPIGTVLNTSGTAPQPQPAPTPTPAPTQQPMEQARSVIKELYKPIEEAQKKEKEFMEKNPWAFDEAQEKAAVGERYNPYYQAELSDYMTGISRRRQRSSEDERKVLQELRASKEFTVGRERRELERAIRSSEEGFAGAGLYFSGERLRKGGELEAEGERGLAEYLRGISGREERATLLGRREREEDIPLEERTTKRKLTAEKESEIMSEMEKARKQSKEKWLTQLREFAGYPYSFSDYLSKDYYGRAYG